MGAFTDPFTIDTIDLLSLRGITLHRINAALDLIQIHMINRFQVTTSAAICREACGLGFRTDGPLHPRVATGRGRPVKLTGLTCVIQPSVRKGTRAHTQQRPLSKVQIRTPVRRFPH